MFYQRLRDLREDKDMNQQEIANIIKTSQSYYAQYECGKRDVPFERIIELAKYYKVSIDYIAGLTNDKRGLTRSELSEIETDVINKLRVLSDERRGKILERLSILYDEQLDESAKIKGAI